MTDHSVMQINQLWTIPWKKDESNSFWYRIMLIKCYLHPCNSVNNVKIIWRVYGGNTLVNRKVKYNFFVFILNIVTHHFKLGSSSLSIYTVISCLADYSLCFCSIIKVCQLGWHLYCTYNVFNGIIN